MTSLDLRQLVTYESSDDEDEDVTARSTRLKKMATSLLSRGQTGRFRERENRKAHTGLDVGAMQTLMQEAESNQYTALHAVRLRFNQTKYLLADMMDSIDDYIHGTVAFSKRRLMMMERLQVAFVGFSGTDEAISMSTVWSGAEDEAIVLAMEELRVKFDEAASKLVEMNDSIDARLTYIDELASDLAKEKQKWKRDLKASSKVQSGNTASFGKLAGASEDMINALSKLELTIGSFPEELDVWTTHSKDVWTPCLVQLIRSFSTLSRDEASEVNKEAIRSLMALQNEVEGTRFQSLSKKGPGGRFEWPKLRVILTSPLLKQYYKTYLAQAHNLENLLFVEAVEDFREKTANLPPNSSKTLALAQSIVERFIADKAHTQINIRALSRQRSLERFGNAPSSTMFDDAYDEIIAMMDRDASINFKQSVLGQDLMRRLSHCKLEADPARILRPTSEVLLTVPSIDLNALEEEQSGSLSSSTDGLKSARRKVGGSFTLRRGRSSTGNGDDPSVIVSPTGSERRNKLGALISPRRRRSSSGTTLRRDSSAGRLDAAKKTSAPATPPLPIKLVDPVVRTSSPEIKPSETLEDALARSPRRPLTIEDESPISPRDMLRSAPDPESPQLSPSSSSRVKSARSPSKGSQSARSKSQLSTPAKEKVALSPRKARDSPSSGNKGGMSPRSKQAKLRIAGSNTRTKI